MEQAELWYSRYREGESAAFDQVIEAYRENLIFFLLRYLLVMEDAEDAAEDAFVELLLHPWKQEKGASLKTYLFTLGRSRALNLLRRQKRRAAFGEAEPPAGEGAELEDRLCRDETRRQLIERLNALAPDYREALYLLYFEDLSLEEAGRVMKKNKKQMENLSYRGKRALRESLGKEDLFL